MNGITKNRALVRLVYQDGFGAWAVNHPATIMQAFRQAQAYGFDASWTDFKTMWRWEVVTPVELPSTQQRS